MTTGAPVLLSATGLTVGYAGARPVLRGVSLSVHEGETVALIGANGAGKSTLLRTLVGRQAVSNGQVTALDQRFGDRSGHGPSAVQARAIRSQIGFVFQNHALVRRLSALSNTVQGLLGLPGGWRAWHQALASDAMRERAVAALASVGLAERAGARVDRLSGGQAQRVSIARAIVRRPRLLIADEPAASLDPAAGHAVMHRFADLARRRGTTLLFTTHDMEHALAYADRVVALKDGAVALDAPSPDLDRAALTALFA